MPQRKPDASTLRAWLEFAGGAVDDAACLRALGYRVAVSHVAPLSAPRADVPAEARGVQLELEQGDLLAQIVSAWDRLGAGQRLTLVDRTSDSTGTAVRRALFAFLEARPGLAARYGRFFDPTDDRSWVDRRPVTALNPGDDRTKWLDAHAAVAERLTPLIVELLRPASVLDLGSGAGHWTRAFKAGGIPDIESVEEGLSGYVPTRRFDVSLCLGVAHRVTATAAMAVIDAATRASDTVVFSVPAAAIGAPGFINERPWAVWHREFLARGFAPHDELRPLIEERFGRFVTPFDLAVVYRRIAARGAAVPRETSRAILAAADRADDLVLQRHWLVRMDDRRNAAPQAQPARPRPVLAYQHLGIEPIRMDASTKVGERIFRYRTAAGSLASSGEGPEPPVVTENGLAVPAATQQGGFAFQSSDGSDPRHNGRRYEVRVPSYVAWLESQTIATIAEHRL